MSKKRNNCDTETASKFNNVNEDYFLHLYGIFDTLDIILFSFHSKHSTHNWNDIRHAFNIMSSTTVSLDDICAIMTVWPSAYNIYWSSNSASKDIDDRLCISMGNLGTANSLSVIESRKRSFRQSVELVLQSSGTIPSSTINQYVLPTCPTHSTSTVRKRQRSVLGVVTQQFALAAPSNSSLSNDGSLLDSLAKQAAEREQARKEEAAMVRANTERKKMINNFKLMPKVCDALRSLFLYSNKTVLPTLECYSTISTQLKINYESTKSAVEQCAIAVPYFVSIVAADKVLSYSVLKINLSCCYKDVRSTVIDKVKTNLAIICSK